MSICSLEGPPSGHPLRRLFEAGVRVTVNSDDPTFFGAGLVDELLLCVERLGFTPAELGTLETHAAEAAFLAPAPRAHLVARVRQAWAAVAGVPTWAPGPARRSGSG